MERNSLVVPLSDLKSLGTPTICEAMGRRGNMCSEIKPIWAGAKIAGTAFTVFCHVGDNLTLHKALALANPGDVLVVNAGGYKECGMWGEIMSLAAQKKGIEGLVVDGAVRDLVGIAGMKFPVFARALSPSGTTKETLSSINKPIMCGGTLVNPGDIVVGDDDGVVVIPQQEMRTVVARSKERAKKEEEVRKLIQQRKSTLEIYGFDKVIKQKYPTER